MTGTDAARADILAAIRAARGTAADPAAVQARIARRARNPLPAPAGGNRADRFLAGLARARATSDRVATLADVPATVAAYLRTRNRPARVRVAPDPALAALPWALAPTLTVSHGAARPDDPVSVTGVVAGVAESGTLIAASGPDHPASLNFLPETHIAVVPASQLVDHYEDAWDRLRQRHPDGLPRMVNMITGPSRSGDIGHTLALGAHGPRQLHVILIDDT